MLPVVGFVFLSVYAFLYIKGDFDFISKELDGLQIITQLHEGVFEIQKLRGLSSIASCKSSNSSEKIAQDIKNVQEKIEQNFAQLQVLLQSKPQSQLQEQILEFIVDLDFKNGSKDFKTLSQIIYELLHFANKVSYACNLRLEPHLDSYVMVDNTVSVLPKVIEYNGQIRASSSAIQNKRLSAGQKDHIKVQMHKIQEQLDLLYFNYSLLVPYEIYQELKQSYEAMINAQSQIIRIVSDQLLVKEKIELEGLNIYEMISKNIDLIIQLQRENVSYLQKELAQRGVYRKALLQILFFVSIFSLFFILYVYYYFYQTNKKYIDTIEKLSITDGMTQLYNRRYFDLIIDQQIKLLHRQKQNFAFMLLDIDFFKQYNDTYGHQAGDEALKKVAECLRRALRRESDMAFRLGGEEFGVVAVDMDQKQVMRLAQKIKKLLAAEKIEHKGSSVSPYLSFSVGVLMVCSKDSWDVNRVYRSADEALYRAKEGGRNKIVFFTPST